VVTRLLLTAVLITACSDGTAAVDAGRQAAADTMSTTAADAGDQEASNPDAHVDAPTDLGAELRQPIDAPVDSPADLRDPSDTAVDTAVLVREAAACVPRRCGVEIACGVAADGCGDSVTCAPCPDVGRLLRLPGARHMVVDKSRNLIYVTVGASDPTYPSSLLVVAPTATTPKVVTSLPVGKDPNVLALSADASRLWVGTDGDNAIRKIVLGSGAPVMGPQYQLPPGANYPHPTLAGAMKVLPASADSVIVSLANVTTNMGVVIMDDGVARAPAVNATPSCLVVGRDSHVFGTAPLMPSDFYDLQTSPQGVASVRFDRLLMGLPRDLVFDRDRVYADTGEVVDVSAPTAPVRLGMLPAWGAPRPLPGDATRLLLISGGPRDGDTVLRTFDTTTFAMKAMVSIAGVTGYFMRDLDLLGTDSIAFIAAGDDPAIEGPTRLVVATTSLLP
jgi:hypothetical protein